MTVCNLFRVRSAASTPGGRQGLTYTRELDGGGDRYDYAGREAGAAAIYHLAERAASIVKLDLTLFYRKSEAVLQEMRGIPGVQGAHAVLCLAGKQGFTSRTLGQRLPCVIWQKIQAELFPEREGHDFTRRVVVELRWVPAGS